MDPTRFAALVHDHVRDRSGAVFYSGRAAFSGQKPVYLLGLNPGGSPTSQAAETVARDLADWRDGPDRWSAYTDRSWRGSEPGTYGIQPRIRHMFDRLGLDLRDVPASNVVFARTNSEAALASEKQELHGLCWPVHRAVIEVLGISTILCLGGTAGRWVRSILRAERYFGRFVEENARGWASEAHLSTEGVCVVTLTHPGRADWRNPDADPTPLVRAALDR